MSQDALSTITGLRRTFKRNNRNTVYRNGADPVFPNVTLEPLAWGVENNAFGSHFAVVNNDAERVITVTTDSYRLLSHAYFLEETEAALKKQGYEGATRTVTMINDGDKMIVEYIFNDREVTLARGDTANPQIVLKNSYDLSWASSIAGGVFRQVCTNGAYVGEANSIRRKHTGQMDAGVMGQAIHSLVDGIPLIEQRLKTWCTEKIPKAAIISAVKLGLTDKEKADLLALKEKTSGLYVIMDAIEKPAIEGGTAGVTVEQWTVPDDTTKIDLWNLFTEFTTHKVPNPVRRDALATQVGRMFATDSHLMA